MNTKRNGLSESLEEYAARLGCTSGEARATWRIEGLRALGFDGSQVAVTGMRIAPGLSVPTRPVQS